VTELCNGGDLEELMKTVKAFSVDRIMQKISASLSLGLHTMHEYKIAHRDLKLANIFIHFPFAQSEAEIRQIKTSEERISESQFTIKIGDLGFSRQLSGLHPNDYCGTPLNMAPEVLNKRPYDFRADIWSLGVMLFELVTQ
jgi:serine/threonine protein kinase